MTMMIAGRIGRTTSSARPTLVLPSSRSSSALASLNPAILSKNHDNPQTTDVIGQKRLFSWDRGDRAYARAMRKKAQEMSYAPPTIAAIPDDPSDPIGDAGAVIRPVGCTRRVFLLNPYLTPDEIEGLAYRVRVLGRNSSLSSVLIATDDDDPRDHDCLPSSVIELDVVRGPEIDDQWAFDPAPGQTWHVAGGYDPVAWFKTGQYRDAAARTRLMEAVQALALATRGGAKESKIPIITIPHGAIQDAGYALCLSTYMIATEQTSLKISNPSRGLTFDPVGYSFILPRLGQEFRQPSAKHPGCGLLMALAGFTADAADMLETGLATHFMENPTAIMGTLERTLGELKPFDQQAIVRAPFELESERQRREEEGTERNDHNKFFRNSIVANTIYAVTSYQADGSDVFTKDDGDDYDFDYPAMFEFDPTRWHQDRTSNLVNYAATFDDIFKQESTVQGFIERFREIAARKTTDPEEQAGIDVASDIANQLQQQAPLAVSVTNRLMQLGKEPEETLETCMARERVAQARLMAHPDFASWAQAQTAADKAVDFTDWKHKSVKEVTDDEIAELLG